MQWPALHVPETHCEFKVQVWPLVSRQLPPEHFCVLVAQVWPHVPQLLLSVERLTQVPEQLANPAWQLKAQALLEQTCPLGQAIPHPPQLLRSLVVLTHCPAQLTRPG